MKENTNAPTPGAFVLFIKEFNESEVWLDLVQMRELIEREKAEETLEHCTALCRIDGASCRTVKNNDVF